MEIYDSSGKKIYDEGVLLLSVNGTHTVVWDYYPESGNGLRAKPGTYTLKYWVTSANPKEVVFIIS